jgi:GNAT superfamily N-acetyltransferase
MTREDVPTESLEDRLTPERIEELDVQFSRDMVAAHRSLYPAARAEALEIGGGVATYMGDLPTSRVLGFGMKGAVDKSTYALVEDFYVDHGARAKFDLCPYADPSVLEALRRRGYRATSWKQILTRSVGAEDHSPPKPSPGIEVQPAEARDLDIWVRVIAQGFLEHDDVDDKSRELYTTLFRTATNSSWLAMVDGVPAGGACLSMRDGIASLATATVLPKQRRRGVQSALIRARLAFAAQSGCTWARVAAFPGSDSQRNLERHGFQAIYTREKFTLG